MAGMVLIVAVVFLFVVVVFLCLLSLLASYKFKYKRKVTSFESGFVPKSIVQTSFSIHFFMIVLVFVVFELELIFLLGVVTSSIEGWPAVVLLYFFIMKGLYLEWFLGKLMWVV